MQTFAFLRGMNLGRRRVRNDELIAALTALGLLEVRAYQAAGNLVFEGTVAASALAAHLEETFDYPVPVLLRSRAELEEVVVRSPWSPEERRGRKVHVSLLDAAPPEEVRDRILSLSTPADVLALDERTLYWMPAGRLTDSELDVARLERSLGLQTRRTLGTLERMLKRIPPA